ncbi:ABC transporter ATP-binding protein [Neobacillus sp. 114]|uniref:ABC transporter ATP-binding protein n=1 Tax=Neobacillus sp. 114 TaxID=3048535 RepID=UPI0024C36BD3|nr:ABC transporter ATP-binding protein [Neobacillus sp. 114]
MEGVNKSFGGIQAIRDLTFEIKSNQITALIGPNGAGKTTIFNLISGFLKPDSGKIYQDNIDITKLQAYQMGNIGVGRTFQDLRIFEDLTVLDNVMVGFQQQSGEKMRHLFLNWRNIKREENERRKLASQHLAYVGLSGKEDEVANNLSYAELKLLSIARMLALDVDTILLDEPCSGLDQKTLDTVIRLVKELVSKGKTICIVEHNLYVVSELADYAIFLDNGHAVATGPINEIMNDPDLKERYLNVV